MWLQIVLAWIVIRVIKSTAYAASFAFLFYAYLHHYKWFCIYLYYKTKGVYPPFCTSILACINGG